MSELTVVTDAVSRTFGPERMVTVGRDPGCDVVVDHDRVSRSPHLELWPRDGDWVLVDRSSDGTYFEDGSRVVGPVAVSFPFRVRLGSESGCPWIGLSVVAGGQGVVQSGTVVPGATAAAVGPMIVPAGATYVPGAGATVVPGPGPTFVPGATGYGVPPVGPDASAGPEWGSVPPEELDKPGRRGLLVAGLAVVAAVAVVAGVLVWQPWTEADPRRDVEFIEATASVRGPFIEDGDHLATEPPPEVVEILPRLGGAADAAGPASPRVVDVVQRRYEAVRVAAEEDGIELDEYDPPVGVALIEDSDACDTDAILDAVKSDAALRQQYASAFGISESNVKGFLGGTTSGWLATDTPVTLFTSGSPPSSRQAMLEAGTAVLSGTYGPVLRCKGGNALLPPGVPATLETVATQEKVPVNLGAGVDRDGRAHAVWLDPSGDSDVIMHSVGEGDQWSPAALIPTPTEPEHLSVQTTPGGDVCIFYERGPFGNDLTGSGMFQRCWSGSGWGDEEYVMPRETWTEGLAPRLAPDGTVVTGFTAYGSGAIYWDPRGGKGDSTSLDPSGIVTHSEFEVDTDNRLHALSYVDNWQHRMSTDSGATWSAPEALPDQYDRSIADLSRDTSGGIGLVDRGLYSHWDGDWSKAVEYSPGLDHDSVSLAFDTASRASISVGHDGITGATPWLSDQQGDDAWLTPVPMASPYAEGGDSLRPAIAIGTDGTRIIVWSRKHLVDNGEGTLKGDGVDIVAVRVPPR